jgi:demethylmenaquinone methyltransferase/2-methoxy-6-polyprenyl-1,4-benzoquinol methylase
MPLLKHFDFLAPIYDRLFSPPEESTLLSLIELPENGHILDAGGGTGRIAQLLTGDKRLVIVQDYSHKMLMQTKSKDEIEAVASETEDLPFPDNCFERVVIVDAYHHLRDQYQSLRELWRVLNIGGMLIIEEPDIRRWAVKFVALAEKLTLMRSHFEPPASTAQSLQTLGAETRVVTKGVNAWIVGYKSR